MNSKELYVCIGHLQNSSSSGVGKLVISDDGIEFFTNDIYAYNQAVFCGEDTTNKISLKVYTNGVESIVTKTPDVEYAVRHRVICVDKWSTQDDIDPNDNLISGFDFCIPELVNWFDDVSFVESNITTASSNTYPPITLHKESPYIQIRFLTENNWIDYRTDRTIRKKIVIHIEFKEPVAISQVNYELNCLMGFWGLLLGKVTDAKDIMLYMKNSKSESPPLWTKKYYLNSDLSYNTHQPLRAYDRPHTTSKLLSERIESYYSNWRIFFFDSKYSLIIRLYFIANSKKPFFLEDIFTYYVRILEGYSLRVSEDEAIAESIKNAIKENSNEIKHVLLLPDVSDAIKKILDNAVPNKKLDIKKIAEWISVGFVGRKSLSSRLSELDEQYFRIISNNASDVGNREENFEYFKKIAASRNFYSHLKNDRTDTLNSQQLHKTVFILKSLIITIFFDRMGISREIIYEIMTNDQELSPRTIRMQKPT